MELVNHPRRLLRHSRIANRRRAASVMAIITPGMTSNGRSPFVGQPRDPVLARQGAPGSQAE